MPEPFFLDQHINIIDRVTLQSFWLICTYSKLDQNIPCGTRVLQRFHLLLTDGWTHTVIIIHTYGRAIHEPRLEISNNVVCATSKGSDQPAHTRSLIRAFASRLIIL